MNVALMKHVYVQTKCLLFSYTVKALYFYQSDEWFAFSLRLDTLAYRRTLFKYTVDEDTIVQSRISYEREYYEVHLQYYRRQQ